MDNSRADLIPQWRCNKCRALLCVDDACQHGFCDGKLHLDQNCKAKLTDYVLSLINEVNSAINNFKDLSREHVKQVDNQKVACETKSNELKRDLLNLLNSQKPTQLKKLRSSVDSFKRQFAKIKSLESLTEPASLTVENPSADIPVDEKGKVEILSLAISRDSKHLAYGLANGCIIIKETNLHKKKLEFVAHSLGVNSLIWSPNSESLISSSLDNTIKIWNNPILKDSTILKEDQGMIKLLSITPDESAFIYSCEEASEICLKLFRLDETTISQVQSIQFPFLSNGSMFIWEFPQGIISQDLQIIPDFYLFTALAYLSQQGQVALGSENGLIYIYDINSVTEIDTLKGHDSKIVCISASDLLLASYSTNGFILVWSIENWYKVQSIPIEGLKIMHLCVALDNRYIVIADSRGKTKSILI